MTNNHVVANNCPEDGPTPACRRVRRRSDGRADDRGAGRFLDIAVLKVDDPGPSALAFDLDRPVDIGADVIAIGFADPLEGDPTVSRGIVSALNRNADVGGRSTDAAINHGNSGGPLLDLYGQVVGIDEQIFRADDPAPALDEPRRAICPTK